MNDDRQNALTSKQIYALGKENAIQFDLAKTELVHFSISKDTKTASIKLPNEEIIQPSTLVRWLGIWFDPGLSFKQHVTIRATQAKTSFYRMARLANSEKGLSPKAMRQLYMACVTSIADYGSILWWKGQNQFKKILQSLQNLALRKILGVFKTSPIKPMEIEAALCPPEDNPIVQPTMKYLLHTKAGIIKTLEFIEATRIATRSWHLNRMHEEEEEEGGEEGGGPEDCD
ncbi:hypothetical protein SS1G_09813 [Sclerotinia sclerotiorum 1980 UF-70]|uniref:Reverse transcriptase domain-containing protein n=1 Tax=Sclerotinia sclerotiorum (strain ATCC 18683 / 1980 / Ss-1) TaxID=665079 RepID=A7EWV4_SCLS1|nr:hypothetical protein SS1G_09813 [Sclerotinia sclerotiorum 1980 UF-70]EDN93946.1 hypothetical protein SS1G_09813 [Sclerotinia sclerotiorum 1980 UF-70]